MAENKKGILVYADWIDKFEELEDDEAGRLIKHFFRYVNDLNPIAPDRTTKLMFIDIENTLKRDLTKWEERANRSRDNGNKGGRPKKPKETQTNPEKPRKTQQVISKPKKPDRDNVSVSDNVNDNVTDIAILFEKETKPKKFIFKDALVNYGFEKQLVEDWLIVRKNKKASNTETAFKSFISEIESRTSNINEMMKICVENSWSGFKYNWVDNLKNSKDGIKKSTGTGTTNAEFKQSAVDAAAKLFGR
jgi:hypothetical protein